MAIIARDGRTLVVHLGMSGQVRHEPGPGKPPAPLTHVHAQWTLDDGSRILFRDPRRFGGLWTLRDVADLDRTLWNELGPDALTIEPQALWMKTRATRRAIKAVLLDQHILAGVGNIYADEALFAAALSPRRLAHRVSRVQMDELARHIRTVLTDAIDLGGSTIRDYADTAGGHGQAQSRHRVYGRAGLPCVRCGIGLRSKPVGQRTTVWCPHCQS